MKIVIDTSALISLAKTNNLHMLLNLKGELFIPYEVYEEAVLAGERKNIPDATAIKKFVEDNGIQTVIVKDYFIRKLFSMLKKQLTKGDSAVLALSEQEGAEVLIADDEGLGKIAITLDFKVMASPDLLLQSLKAGSVGFKEFEKNIRLLVIENRLSPVVAELYMMEGKEYVEDKKDG